MPRFFVEPPYGANDFLVDAGSREAVEEHFGSFADFRVRDLETERPERLTDFSLDVIGRRWSYALGDPEPSWLSSMLDHLVNGDVYRWYELVERSDDGSEQRIGRLGSRVPKGPGSLLHLPGSRRLTVAVVRPAEPPLEAELVLVA